MCSLSQSCLHNMQFSAAVVLVLLTKTLLWSFVSFEAQHKTWQHKNNVIFLHSDTFLKQTQFFKDHGVFFGTPNLGPLKKGEPQNRKKIRWISWRGTHFFVFQLSQWSDGHKVFNWLVVWEIFHFSIFFHILGIYPLEFPLRNGWPYNSKGDLGMS